MFLLLNNIVSLYQKSIVKVLSFYSASGSCISDPCKHGGICTPTGLMTYYCQCPDDRYGDHCEKRMIK